MPWGGGNGRGWAALSLSLCAYTPIHTQGVKNSSAKGDLRPHCNNACEYAKEESNENTALSLSLSVTPGKSSSLAPVALVHGKTRGLCLCCAEDKALSAFLPKDVEPMIWELCPLHHCCLQPEAAEGKLQTIPAVLAEMTSVILHTCGLHPAPVTHQGISPWDDPGAMLGRKDASGVPKQKMMLYPSNKGCSPSIQSPQFLSHFHMRQPAVVVVLLPAQPNIPTERRGKEADWILYDQREGETQAVASQHTHDHQHRSLWPFPPLFYPTTAYSNALHCWPQLTTVLGSPVGNSGNAPCFSPLSFQA